MDTGAKVTGVVDVNGAMLYYEKQGTGPSILLIAGSTGDAGHFSRSADLLADEFTVVVYDRRGNSRSPRPPGWTVTSVAEQADDAAGLIRAPFNLKVKFESFGGARIDTDSVVVTYKKVPAIDLTQRVKTFIDASGFTVEGVQVPPGEHRIRVDVADNGGRKGWTEFVIRVAQ